MRILNPPVVRMSRVTSDRDTVRNVAAAGFEVRMVQHLWRDIITRIEADRPQEAAPLDAWAPDCEGVVTSCAPIVSQV